MSLDALVASGACLIDASGLSTDLDVCDDFPWLGILNPTFVEEDTTTRKAGAYELSVNPRGYTHQQLPSARPWQRRVKKRRRVIE
ncbi:hypothetical protein Bca4012_006340 [Brassica carinata]|uniref:Uncharacterized protein n=1 Tax=Brassica carinata TaxID=52824 RepID=A0A8X7UY59_BRACI|nr:hypothetical protein Bca52824_039460 [Brassica carinata]